MLEEIWQTLSENLTLTQIHALNGLIEARREEWQAAPDDETFRRFCEDALCNANVETTRIPPAWAARGLLTDAVELFLHILKQHPEE